MGNDLNKEQQEAVDHLNGPLLVLAGAGTGKTKMLIARLQHLIEEGVNPCNILMFTFTNVAAREMVTRAEEALGKGACNGLTACTFHSFCLKVLHHFGSRVNMYNGFTILGSGDAIDAISYCIPIVVSKTREEGKGFVADTMTDSSFRATDVSAIFSLCVNKKCKVEEACPEIVKKWAKKDSITQKAYIQAVYMLWDEYSAYKEERQTFDYNDLLLRFLKLMEVDELARQYVNDRFVYKMVDEYQDTNLIQLEIIKAVSRTHDNVCAVGDDQQSIYAFNGARFQNILQYQKDFPGARVIILKENYRSSQEILDLANAVILSAKEKFPKALHGQFHGSTPVLREVGDNRYSMVDFLMNEIRRRMSGNEKMSEVCIMYRASYEIDLLEKELILDNIPYRKYGGLRIADKAYVRDILAFLRVLMNCRDQLAWFRLLQLYPYIGPVNAQDISSAIMAGGLDAIRGEAYSRRVFHTSLQSLLQVTDYLSQSDFTEQVDFLLGYYFDQKRYIINNSQMKASEKEKELRQVDKDEKESPILRDIAGAYESASEFVEAMVMNSTDELKDEDGVVLTTVHSAKGREWDTVYLLNACDAVMPRNGSDVEEERRCFYVAVTRPRKELVIVSPLSYCCFGRTEETSPTVFLTESPEVRVSYDVIDVDGTQCLHADAS